MNQLCYQTGGGRFLRSFTPFTTLRLTSPLAQGFQSPLRTQFQHVFSGSSYESWNVNQKKKKKVASTAVFTLHVWPTSTADVAE